MVVRHSFRVGEVLDGDAVLAGRPALARLTRQYLGRWPSTHLRACSTGWPMCGATIAVTC